MVVVPDIGDRPELRAREVKADFQGHPLARGDVGVQTAGRTGEVPNICRDVGASDSGFTAVVAVLVVEFIRPPKVWETGRRMAVVCSAAGCQIEVRLKRPEGLIAQVVSLGGCARPASPIPTEIGRWRTVAVGIRWAAMGAGAVGGRDAGRRRPHV